MNSYKPRLSCTAAPKAGEARDRFRSAFPAVAPGIIETFERAVSRQTRNADLVGRTSEGFEVFWLEEAVCVGSDIFTIGVLFEVKFTSALWLKFEWSKNTVARPDSFSAALTLEEVLDSLRNNSNGN